ncbi:hypothetical protein M231_02210 [Tremella mesenterica]|uniref:Uncharacterized protein n=1 Tax=Tremella mesenterica TaxID=5217 RepID=A0A4Q1BRH0_TREME|nr:hypothetical protein M231_02210 [Tremella mesenterica]
MLDDPAQVSQTHLEQTFPINHHISTVYRHHCGELLMGSRGMWGIHPRSTFMLDPALVEVSAVQNPSRGEFFPGPVGYGQDPSPHIMTNAWITPTETADIRFQHPHLDADLPNASLPTSSELSNQIVSYSDAMDHVYSTPVSSTTPISCDKATPINNVPTIPESSNEEGVTMQPHVKDIMSENSHVTPTSSLSRSRRAFHPYHKPGLRRTAKAPDQLNRTSEVVLDSPTPVCSGRSTVKEERQWDVGRWSKTFRNIRQAGDLFSEVPLYRMRNKCPEPHSLSFRKLAALWHKSLMTIMKKTIVISDSFFRTQERQAVREEAVSMVAARWYANEVALACTQDPEAFLTLWKTPVHVSGFGGKAVS